MTAIVSFPSPGSPETAPRASWSAAGEVAADIDPAFRQLRHHTKNALQRILCHVALQPGLNATAAGRVLARDLERRIQLVAAISDALFGFTRSPEALEPRLRSLGRSVVELMCDPGQLITLEAKVEGACPRGLEEALVRVAHELIGNAVKHGMHVRLVGRIDIAVRTVGRTTTMTVSDDGWGYAAQPVPGEGLSVARMLAEQHGGELRMRRERDITHVTLVLSHAAAHASLREARS